MISDKSRAYIKHKQKHHILLVFRIPPGEMHDNNHAYRWYKRN